MTQPYFSVIIPTYNRASFIEKTVHSVLNQSFVDFELLIIDDGSTDNTKEIISAIQDARIRYIYQENKERGAARNNGITQSKGNYITFLDSDDYFYEYHLERVYQNLQKANHPVFFHQHFKIIDSNGVEKFPLQKNVSNPIKILLTRGNYIAAMGIFIHYSIKEDIFFDEDRNLSGVEDFEFLLRMMMKYQMVSNLEKTAVIVHHDERGEMMVSKEKLLTRTLLFVDKMKANQEFMQNYRKYFGRFKAVNYSLIALFLANGKEKRTSLFYVFQALKSDFFFLFKKRLYIIIYCIAFR
jgi:glycosyltransferase involved in cell wall biosynthesis